MSLNIRQLQAEFTRNYEANLLSSVKDGTPFAILMKQLEQKFKDKTLTGKEQAAQATQGLLTMAQAIYNISGQGAWTVISLALQDERDDALNDAKKGLLNAQASTERKKPELINQQIKQLAAAEYIKILDAIGNIIFGYASGGVDIPSAMMSKQEQAYRAANSAVMQMRL